MVAEDCGGSAVANDDDGDAAEYDVINVELNAHSRTPLTSVVAARWPTKPEVVVWLAADADVVAAVTAAATSECPASRRTQHPAIQAITR